MKNPYLSIIIPAYNEAERLPASLRKIDAFLSSQPYEAEVLVVENGSTDGTFETVQAMRAAISNLEVMHEDTRGKGWAVRQGMLAAHQGWAERAYGMKTARTARGWPLTWALGTERGK